MELWTWWYKANPSTALLNNKNINAQLERECSFKNTVLTTMIYNVMSSHEFLDTYQFISANHWLLVTLHTILIPQIHQLAHVCSSRFETPMPKEKICNRFQQGRETMQIALFVLFLLHNPIVNQCSVWCLTEIILDAAQMIKQQSHSLQSIIKSISRCTQYNQFHSKYLSM